MLVLLAVGLGVDPNLGSLTTVLALTHALWDKCMPEAEGVNV